MTVTSRSRLLAMLVLVGAAVLTAGAGCGDRGEGPGSPCDYIDCSGHGTCSDQAGSPECACETGYTGLLCQDCEVGYVRNASEICEPGDTCAEGDPCGDHGTCQDGDGAVTCLCDEGYAGEFCDACYAGYHDDGTGACVLDEQCLANTCSLAGDCEDGSGTPVCSCFAGYAGDHCEACATGYHRTPGGSCAADVACDLDPCSGHGTCDDSSGEPLCTCDPGYAGDECADCYPGYHDDGSGACVLDEQCLPTSCSGHETYCDVVDGLVTCICAAAYSGTHCEECATGYHWDLSGECVTDEVCGAGECEPNGSCVVQGGVKSCVCNAGYAGILCETCEPGYHRDSSNVCVVDTSCLTTTCSDHGTCEVLGGVAQCTACDAGYAGAHCELCAPSYHLDSGLCVADDVCGAGECEPNGTCEVADGLKSCVCQTGYAGGDCNGCYAGYHDDGGGVCVLDEQCLPTSCSGHEALCSVVNGLVACVCDDGYAGDHCDQCAASYHWALSGICVANDVCGMSECEPNGSCVVQGGVKSCVCDAGYTGLQCEVCAAGYHRDAANVCVVDTGCLSTTCSGHGTCEVLGGVAQCTACDTGYAGAHCELCAPSYHLDLGLCVANDVCVANECGPHGNCEVHDGVKSCVCLTGYAGEFCDSCYAGYHDDGGGVCVLDEQCLPSSCSGHEISCSVVDGLVSCQCEAEYDGAHCELCATDFHWDTTGACVADDVCGSGECEPNGSCVLQGGVKSCVCDAGYAGLQCEVCAAGYHRDTANACVVDTGCLPTTCSGHGTCQVVGGVAQCTSCDAGYAGAHCELCAPSYHLDAGACVADDVCGVGECAPHGSCVVQGGAKSCVCQTGYAGADCNDCYAGYAINLLTGLCEIPCEGQAWYTIRCNGLCVNGLTNPYCGGCSLACPGDEQCRYDYETSGGECYCPTSGQYTQCGGVCTNLWASEQHCGQCGQACLAGERCFQGRCVLDESSLCAGGFPGDYCGPDDQDQLCCPDWHGSGYPGCAYSHDLEDDPQHCGDCHTQCNAGELCVMGHCVAGSPGADCGGTCTSYQLCCEGGTNPDYCMDSFWFRFDDSNCGGCGVVCSSPESCDDGQCRCPSEWGSTEYAECGGVCLNVQFDENNCGGCGVQCGVSQRCFRGQCLDESPSPCTPTYCSDTAMCCLTTLGNAYCLYSWDAEDDRFNCGGCGIECSPSENCENGVCGCSFPYGECGGACIDLSTPENCGGCANACGLYEECEQNFQLSPDYGCVCQTDFGMWQCGDECADISWDERHCGACDNPCNTDERCLNRVCVPETATCADTCDDQSICCDGVPDPTCVSYYSMRSDMNNCGGCGILCGAGEACLNGTCMVPPGETCADAEVVIGTNGSINRALCAYADDGIEGRFATGCPSETDAGAEYYFVFTAPADGMFSVSGNGPFVGFVVGVLDVASDPCSSMTVIDCGSWNVDSSIAMTAGETVQVIVFQEDSARCYDFYLYWGFNEQ